MNPKRRKFCFPSLQLACIDSLCFVGKQVGNRIEKTDDIDTISCYENVHNREELLKTDKFLFKMGTGFGVAFNVILIVLGSIFVVTKPGFFKSKFKFLRKDED